VDFRCPSWNINIIHTTSFTALLRVSLEFKFVCSRQKSDNEDANIFFQNWTKVISIYLVKITQQVSQRAWSKSHNRYLNAHGQNHATGISTRMVKITQQVSQRAWSKSHNRYLNAHGQTYATEYQCTWLKLFSRY
jgi:hypothetical protein